MLHYWEEELGRTLLVVAPPDWRRLDLRATLVHRTEEERATAVLADGSTVPLDWPATGIVTLNELRNAQQDRDSGTWVAMRMVLDPRGTYSAYYNFELNPAWAPAVPPEDYLEDMNPFPRKPEFVPTWWDGRDLDYGDRDRALGLIKGVLQFDVPPTAALVRVTAQAGRLVTAELRTLDGAQRPWTPPPILGELLRHHHDAGAPWRSATLEFALGGTTSAEFT